jgi:hypothetical protein
MLKAEVIDQSAFHSLMDDYQENLQLRTRMFEESQQQNQYDDEEEDEETYGIPGSGEETKEPSTRAVRGRVTSCDFIECQAGRDVGVLEGEGPGEHGCDQ